MRTLLTLVLVSSMVAFTFVAWAQQSNPPANAANDTSSLQELLTQRRDTLQRLLELRSAQFHRGLGSYREVQQVVGELIDAKLQLTTDHAERIKLHQEHVASLRKFEEATQSLVEVGQGNQADVLIAQAARLNAEIRLRQEESIDN